MNDYAVFDLETTGFSAAQDRITEIGWLVVRDGKPGPAQAQLVAAGEVPADVAALTGITTTLLVAEGRPLPDVLRRFLAETAGLPLVGHNCVRFDAPFLEAACCAEGFAPPERGRYWDTAAVYKAQALGLVPVWPAGAHYQFALAVLSRRVPGLKYNLGHCCDTLGIDRADVTAHRARGDVQLTQRLYAALTAPA